MDVERLCVALWLNANAKHLGLMARLSAIMIERVPCYSRTLSDQPAPDNSDDASS